MRFFGRQAPHKRACKRCWTWVIPGSACDLNGGNGAHAFASPAVEEKARENARSPVLKFHVTCSFEPVGIFRKSKNRPLVCDKCGKMLAGTSKSATATSERDDHLFTGTHLEFIKHVKEKDAGEAFVEIPGEDSKEHLVSQLASALADDIPVYGRNLRSVVVIVRARMAQYARALESDLDFEAAEATFAKYGHMLDNKDWRFDNSIRVASETRTESARNVKTFALFSSPAKPNARSRKQDRQVCLLRPMSLDPKHCTLFLDPEHIQKHFESFVSTVDFDFKIQPEPKKVEIKKSASVSRQSRRNAKRKEKARKETVSKLQIVPRCAPEHRFLFIPPAPSPAVESNTCTFYAKKDVWHASVRVNLSVLTHRSYVEPTNCCTLWSPRLTESRCESINQRPAAFVDKSFVKCCAGCLKSRQTVAPKLKFPGHMRRAIRRGSLSRVRCRVHPPHVSQHRQRKQRTADAIPRKTPLPESDDLDLFTGVPLPPVTFDEFFTEDELALISAHTAKPCLSASEHLAYVLARHQASVKADTTDDESEPGDLEMDELEDVYVGGPGDCWKKLPHIYKAPGKWRMTTEELYDLLVEAESDFGEDFICGHLSWQTDGDLHLESVRMHSKFGCPGCKNEGNTEIGGWMTQSDLMITLADNFERKMNKHSRRDSGISLSGEPVLVGARPDEPTISPIGTAETMTTISQQFLIVPELKAVYRKLWDWYSKHLPTHDYNPSPLPPPWYHTQAMPDFPVGNPPVNVPLPPGPVMPPGAHEPVIHVPPFVEPRVPHTKPIFDHLPPIGGEPITAPPTIPHDPTLPPIDGLPLPNDPIVVPPTIPHHPNPVDQIPMPQPPLGDPTPGPWVPHYPNLPIDPGLDWVYDLFSRINDIADAIWDFVKCSWDFFERFDIFHTVVEFLHDHTVGLAGVLVDVATGAYDFFTTGAPVIKMILFLLQDFTEYHGPEIIYRRALHAYGQLCSKWPAARITDPSAGVFKPEAIEVPRVYENVLNTTMSYDSTHTIANELLRSATNAVQNATKHLDSLPRLFLGNSASDDTVDELQEAFPEYVVVRSTTTAPHPTLAAVRRVFRNRCNEFAAAHQQTISLVGASASELAHCPTAVHNCAPRLTGRDTYRQDHATPWYNHHHRRLSVDHTFQQCPDHHNGQSIKETVVQALFSAHDIAPEDFIRSMGRRSSTQALVALLLPFPMMDRRIESYHDPVLNVTYVKRDAKLHVFIDDEFNAGYSHDFETVMKWMMNMPVFRNAHVQRECLGQVGTCVLFLLTIGEGRQEIVPSTWTLPGDEFYILPLLTDRTLATSLEHFAVPRRRFEQLTAFVATLKPTERNNEYVMGKIRGLMAEVKIGKHRVEPRWAVTTPQLYSLAAHAIMCDFLHSASTGRGAINLKAYFVRQLERSSTNLAQRFVRGVKDLVAFNALGEKDPLHSAKLVLIGDIISSRSLDHTNTYNPYALHGKYRLVNDVLRHSDKLTNYHVLSTAALDVGEKLTIAASTTAAAGKTVAKFFAPDEKVVKNKLRKERPKGIDAQNEVPGIGEFKVKTKGVGYLNPKSSQPPVAPPNSVASSDADSGSSSDGASSDDSSTTPVSSRATTPDPEDVAANVPLPPSRPTSTASRSIRSARPPSIMSSPAKSVTSIQMSKVNVNPKMQNGQRFPGLCAIDCAPLQYRNDLLWAKHFGMSRFSSGWFTSSEVASFYHTAGVIFAVENADGTLQFPGFSSDLEGEMEVLVYKFIGPLNRGHWSESYFKTHKFVRDPCLHGIRFPCGKTCSCKCGCVEAKKAGLKKTKSIRVDEAADRVYPDHVPEASESASINNGANVPVGTSGQLIDQASIVDPEALFPPTTRQMVFDGPLYPVIKQHPADEIFSTKFPEKFSWPVSPIQIDCPSSGALQILDDWWFNEHDTIHVGPLSQPPDGSSPYTHSRMLSHLAEGVFEGALFEKIKAYVQYQQSPAPKERDVDVLLIQGPAMSAKTSLAKQFIARQSIHTAVYSPSRKLAKEWSQTGVNSMARNDIPTIKNAQLLIIDEVFNFTAIEIWLMFRTALKLGVKKVLLIGDVFQKEKDSISVSHAYFARSLVLHTSLGMPLDAHRLFVAINGLDTRWFQTTGTKKTSVYFVPGDGYQDGRLRFKLYKQIEPASIINSIGTVQGVRPKHSYLDANLSVNQLSWLHDSTNRLSVAYTRHTETMIVRVPSLMPQTMTNGLRVISTVVAAPVNSFQKSYAPQPIDDLLLPVNQTQRLDSFSKLRSILSAPLSFDGHVNRQAMAEPVLDPVHIVANVGPVHKSEIQSIVYSKTNFELVEPAEIDRHAGDPTKSYKIKFTDPGPPIQSKDVRNDIDNAHHMAAIHVNKSGWSNLTNLIERQLDRSKASIIQNKDYVEAKRLYSRFRTCFYDKNATLLYSEEESTTWLLDSLSATIKQIAMSAPLMEDAKTIGVDAEFKTQSKAKAVEGFAATNPYGQSILANSKVFNAEFAAEQPKLYRNLARIVRPGVILDYGMTDDELSQHLLKLGVADDFASATNLQVDISKQDSSHTAALLLVFIMIARDCGLSEESLQLYLTFCSSYKVKSRGADGATFYISFNLGSGDPFTLIRNDIMELTIMAARYFWAHKAVWVAKGDDIHSNLKDLTLHRLAGSASVAAVALKIDVGEPGYHAGRFHDGHRYLVDPVRAFMKHLTRIADENVSDLELYRSYVSRATDYTPAEFEFLLLACQVHYPFFSGEQIHTIIGMMIALRSKNVFLQYSKLPPQRFVKHIDTTDCAVSVARALKPNLAKSWYSQFRGCSASHLLKLFGQAGIPAIYVARGQIAPNISNVAIITDSHVSTTIDFGSNPRYDL